MFDIYGATGGVREIPAMDFAQILFENGIKKVEMSGGKHCQTPLKNYGCSIDKYPNLQIHNYFPPPKIPFVFNLASLDKANHQSSLELARQAMRLSLEIGSSRYSFHAGFRITPKASELGEVIKPRLLQDRDASLQCFMESVLLLAEEAQSLGVELLVENNVLNKINYESFQDDPLLLTRPDEICKFMNGMPSNVSLLMDVGHLKVSGLTLDFDYIEAHKDLIPHIGGYHLSDNEGLQDTNDPISESSWFWDDISTKAKFYTIEVYHQPPEILKKQVTLVEKKLFDQKFK